MTTNNNKNDLKTENFDQESKDDWRVNDNDNMNENNICIETPSFIRLFVIRRIIDKYIKNNKDKKKKTKEEIIKEMANGFEDDKNIESLVINIVTRLINDGIKKYMEEYYDEKQQSNIIEDIFCKIILEKFKEEYNEMIKYGINNQLINDNYYQNLLFNSSDLMTHIFQYLEWGWQFNRDLYSCSLVSSHWLYHVLNVNSVYHVAFYKLDGGNIDNVNNKKCTRIWQRLYNAKSIEIIFDVRDSKEALTTVNKLPMFRKIEKVDVDVSTTDINECILALIAIMSRCKDRIKYCRIKIDCFDSPDLMAPSPLRLPKAQHVEICDSLFYRMWTNECTKLTLNSLYDISKDWCKFVIANCDCSNITRLTLDSVTFHDDDHDDHGEYKVILKQLALKFYNLKTLEIQATDKVDDNVLLFWQLLKAIISKNKGKVKLTVNFLDTENDYSLLSQRMNEKNLKIDKLIIHVNDNNVNEAIEFIQERDNRGLKHLEIPNTISDRYTKKLLHDHELKYKSITTFELKHNNIKFVNPLLEWKMISEKQMFVIIDVYGYHRDYHDGDEVLSLFKQLCENIYQLLVQQIAFDIKIEFKQVEDSKLLSSCLSLYLSYFQSKEFLSKYNSPNCNDNKLCLPRDKPYTYFYIHDSTKDKWERYFVFGATNVQMK